MCWGAREPRKPSASSSLRESILVAGQGRKSCCMITEKAWVSWSSGKDSAWALEVTRRRNESEVVALLTTVNQTHHRVAMHAVRENLLEQQADALGLPLVKVWLPWPCPNADYENAMAAAVKHAQNEGVSRMVFGDLFLEDVRQYREEKLAGTGIQPAFPLWGMNTTELASQMIEAGLRAYVTCVDPKKLDPSFAGRAFDAALLADLPAGADPCGAAADGVVRRHSGSCARNAVDRDSDSDNPGALCRGRAAGSDGSGARPCARARGYAQRPWSVLMPTVPTSGNDQVSTTTSGTRRFSALTRCQPTSRPRFSTKRHSRNWSVKPL